MTQASVKAFLSFLIQLLAKLVPGLSGLLGGPLGWLIGIGLSWLAAILYNLIERLARFAKIDAEISAQITEAKNATDALKQVQKDPDATPEQRAKGLADFTNAVRSLGHFVLR